MHQEYNLFPSFLWIAQGGYPVGRWQQDLLLEQPQQVHSWKSERHQSEYLQFFGFLYLDPSVSGRCHSHLRQVRVFSGCYTVKKYRFNCFSVFWRSSIDAYSLAWFATLWTLKSAPNWSIEFSISSRTGCILSARLRTGASPVPFKAPIPVVKLVISACASRRNLYVFKLAKINMSTCQPR